MVVCCRSDQFTIRGFTGSCGAWFGFQHWRHIRIFILIIFQISGNMLHSVGIRRSLGSRVLVRREPHKFCRFSVLYKLFHSDVPFNKLFCWYRGNCTTFAFRGTSAPAPSPVCHSFHRPNERSVPIGHVLALSHIHLGAQLVVRTNDTTTSHYVSTCHLW